MKAEVLKEKVWVYGFHQHTLFLSEGQHVTIVKFKHLHIFAIEEMYIKLTRRLRYITVSFSLLCELFQYMFCFINKIKYNKSTKI